MSVMSRITDGSEAWQSQDVTDLVSLWERRRADRVMPRFEDIGFKALDLWLDRIVVIRTDFRAQEFSFHYVGEGAERHFGRNVTGSSAISVLGTQAYVSLMRYLDAVQTKQRPIHSVIPYATGPHLTGRKPQGTLERLFLPCAEGSAMSAVILFMQAGDAQLPSHYAVL